MAIVQNPITGRTKKKFGTAVFAKQFGKNTMRTKPIEVANPRTLKQREQRAKFSLMVELSRYILSFIRIGFKQVAIGMSEFNSFMKTNIKEVITGAYPAYTIDFTKLVVSKGNKVNITWDENSGYGDALATDKAMILIINDTKKGVKADTTSRTREELFSLIEVPTSWIGDVVHVYLAFSDENGKVISDSQYIDTLTILA